MRRSETFDRDASSLFIRQEQLYLNMDKKAIKKHVVLNDVLNDML